MSVIIAFSFGVALCVGMTRGLAWSGFYWIGDCLLFAAFRTSVTLGELRPTMRVPRGRCSLDERRHYRSFRGLSSSRQPKASAFAQAVVFTRREFSGMELDEVVHARRRLASELEEVVSHAVVTPLLVELGRHCEVVDEVRWRSRLPKPFAPLGEGHVAIADRPAERLGKHARVVV